MPTHCAATAALRAAMATALALFVAACSPEPEMFHAQFTALGTVVDISLWDTSKERGEAAVAAARETMDAFHTRWHAWHPSELMSLNERLARGETVPVAADTRVLLERAAQISHASGDRFNPAIGQLIALWGFHSDALPKPPPPPPGQIANLVAKHPSMADLHFVDAGVNSTNTSIKLDFGAYAKGLAVDAAIDRLKAMGFANAIVNAGGDLRAIGAKGKQPWRIGVRNPRGSGVIAAIETRGDESIFTSGDYERYFEYEGRRYHHIIDPATGYPAQGIASATILHPKAAEAVGASTALVVAGREHWREVARQMGIDTVMLITTDQDVLMTPSMAERVRFTIEPKSVQVVP